MFVRLLTQYRLQSNFFQLTTFFHVFFFACQLAGIETKFTRLRTESRGYTRQKSNSLVSFGSVKHYMHDKAVHIFYGTGAFLGQATVSQHLLTPI